MLHKHFVIFRSIYYTGKLNKQINNGPAESFSISYSYLTRFTLCLWNLISYFLFVFVVAVVFFPSDINFQKEMLCCRKGWERPAWPSSELLYIWLVFEFYVMSHFFFFQNKQPAQDCFLHSLESNDSILGSICLQACMWCVILVCYIPQAQCRWHMSHDT